MRVAPLLSLVFTLLPLASCEKDEPATAPGEEAAKPASPSANVDPKLLAVASAAAAAPNPGPMADDAGPPVNGILNPAKAEEEARLGARPKLVLGSEGAAPRIALRAPALLPAGQELGTLQVMLQSDPGAGSLPIDFDVAIAFTKPKTSVTPSGSGPKSANATAEARSDSIRTVITVRGAKLGLVGAPGAQELDKKLMKLKGATVAFTLDNDGAATDLQQELPKGADPEYADVIRTLSEGIGTLVLPYPDKPVGLNAYWMITNRDHTMGLDVVSYRMVKVTKLVGSQASLSVSVKRYVVGSRFDVPGVATDGPMEIDRFESAAEGSLDVAPERLLPLTGQVNLMLSAMLKPNAVYQSQSGVRLSFGPSIGGTPNAASKAPSAPK